MNELVKTLLTSFACKPTGSRVLGGVTADSDWDYYSVDSYLLERWLVANGFLEQSFQGSEYDARSWRHKSFPVNVIACEPDYYHAFDFAAQSAAKKIADPSGAPFDFSTRDGRVEFFKARLLEWHLQFDLRAKIEKRQPA